MLRSSRYRSTNEPQPSELNPSTTVQSKRPPSLDIPQNRSDSRPSDMVQSKRPPPLPSAATLPRNAMASLMSEVRASGGRVSGEKPAVRKSVPPPLPAPIRCPARSEGMWSVPGPACRGRTRHESARGS